MTAIVQAGRRDARRAVTPGRERHRLRNLVLVLLAGLLGAAAGWVYGGLGPPSYQSAVRLELYPLPGNPYATLDSDDLVTMQTEAQQVKSDEVVTTAAENSGFDGDLEMLRRRISVSVTTGSVNINVNFRAGDEEVSREVASALARATLGLRKQRAQLQQQQSEALLRQQLKDVRQALARADSAPRRQALTDQVVFLQAQLQQLDAQILDPGEWGTSGTWKTSTKKKQVVLAAGGAVAAAAVAAVLIFGWGRLRARRRRRSAAAAQVAVRQ